jgi:hypothetical protein
VGTASKGYHCQLDPHCGKIKAGAYMSEAADKAPDDGPRRGKACS